MDRRLFSSSRSAAEIVQSGDRTAVDAEIDSSFDFRQFTELDLRPMRTSGVSESDLHSRLFPRGDSRSTKIRPSRLVLFERFQRIRL